MDSIMQKLVSLVIILLVLGTMKGFSQKVGRDFLPPKSAEMPEWFEVFYREEGEKIAITRMDSLASAYENRLKKTKGRPPEDKVLTGEELEDAYLRYYKRWRRFAVQFTDENEVTETKGESAESSFLPVSQKIQAANSAWTLLGPTETFWNNSNTSAPWQVNVYAIDAAPSNANILYACPETGGIFKTTDKGLNWECKTLEYPINSCGAVKVHPSNPDTAYAGRNNQWIHTADGGTTWDIQAMPWGGVNEIAIKPTAPYTAFVATSNGLFRKQVAGATINQGTTFNIASLNASSPKWNRATTSGTACTASAGTNHYYSVFSFTVSVSGSYTFMMCTPISNWDGHASLFQNIFDPSNPCGVPANHLYSDDDANSGGNCGNDPLITVSLVTGTTYYLVSTSYNPNVTGTFQWTFTGPGGANLTSLVPGWIQVPGMNTSCTDIFFKTDDENILFCLKKNGGFTEFWRSLDGGNTFSPSINGWTGKGITADGGGRMTVTPADPNRIYAVLLGSAPSPDRPFVFRSNDAGLTWDTLCTGRGTGLIGNGSLPLGMSNGQGFYDLDIAVSALDANQLIVATTSAFRSVDGGISFTPLGGYLGNFGIHPDIQQIITIGGDTWITTDGGINYSSDFFGAIGNFSPRFKGIYSSDMWGFAQGWNEDIVGGGRYHNGNTALSETYPVGEAIRLGGGEAATGYYMVGRPRHIAFSDIAPKVIPVTRNNPSTDFSFTKFPNEDGYGNDMSEVAFLPYCYNTIFVGSGNELWKSADGGITWVSIHTFAGRVKEFEISRSNPDVIYLATNSPTQLQKSTDGGISWSILSLPPGASISRVSLSLSYSDENRLYMVSPSNSLGNRVFVTTDGGASWSNLTTPTINNMTYTAIVYHNGTDNGVYILGDNGIVFYKSDSEPDWVPFSTGLPLVHNNEHVLAFYRDSKLRSAGNQGIWQVEFYEEGTPVAQPTVDKLTSSCPRDTFYFEDYSALNHTAATWAWTFTGAAYVSATSARNPKVLFSGAGTFDFSLTVTNPMGSSTKTVTGKITITGNECGVDTIPGKLLTLTTAGDYAAQTVPLNLTTNNFTVGGWIKPNGIQMSNAGIFFSGSSGACGLNFRTANQLGYHWNDNAGTYNWGGGPTLPANQWSYVALVIKDGPGTNDTAFIYLNGAQYLRVGNHSPATLSTVFQFGIDRSNTSRNFIGQIDEVSFYDRALSRNEIREIMNLTRNNPNGGSMPGYDVSLIAYYQFNENNSLTFDKIGTKHVTLVGGATKSTLSTAPVGGGNFQRMSVASGGVKNFATPGLSMTFPSAGVYPNGDLVVTRLHVPADELCGTNTLPNPTGYWIVRNYGSNATFSSLTEMKFHEVSGTNPAMVLSPSSLTLFKRNSNDFGLTWGSFIEDADAVTTVSGLGDITFSSGLYVVNFSQFSISSDNLPLPVSDLYFEVRADSQTQARLSWTIKDEVGVEKYEIEYHKEGNGFEYIGEKSANGGDNYYFIHSDLPSGTHYYRLKIRDINGNSSYSNTQSIELLHKDALSIYPNPIEEGWLNLMIHSTSNKGFARIYNALGQVVHTFAVSDISIYPKQKTYLPLSAGIYHLFLTLENGVTMEEKIIIE